jgi:uncharacterized protein YegJ (DUF2314 family)
MVVAIGAVPGCGREGGDESTSPKSASTDQAGDDEQAMMDRAMARAQATWEQFAVALSEAEPGRDGFAIKKGFPYGDAGGRDAGIEYVWIGDVSWNGEVFHGVVNNQPLRATGVAAGDRVEVRPEALADWMYLDGKTLRGGYTIRVLYWADPEGQVRKAMDAQGIEVGPVEE